MENIGNFPEKYDGNFRKFFAEKCEIFPTIFPPHITSCSCCNNDGR